MIKHFCDLCGNQIIDESLKSRKVITPYGKYKEIEVSLTIDFKEEKEICSYCFKGIVAAALSDIPE